MGHERFLFLIGSKGNVVINLARPININAIVISHAPLYKLYQQGIKSAPKELLVYGIEKSKKVLLGEIKFDPNSESSLLTPVTKKGKFSKVMVTVNSNWGNQDWTCLYRVAVHGKEI